MKLFMKNSIVRSSLISAGQEQIGSPTPGQIMDWYIVQYVQSSHWRWRTMKNISKYLKYAFEASKMQTLNLKVYWSAHAYRYLSEFVWGICHIRHSGTFCNQLFGMFCFFTPPHEKLVLKMNSDLLIYV